MYVLIELWLIQKLAATIFQDLFLVLKCIEYIVRALSPIESGGLPQYES